MNIAGALQSHSAKQIINFLSTQYPQLGPKVKQAAAAGYTAEQIVEFINRNQQGLGQYKKGKYKDIQRPYEEDEDVRDTNPYLKSSRLQGNQNPTEKFVGQIGNVLGDAGRSIPGAAIGAAVGGATGGPMGAVAGAVGGSTTLNDMIKRYQSYTQEGGDGSFGEFLSGLAKSVGKGVAAGGAAYASGAGLKALITQLPQLLQNPKFAEFFSKKPQGTQVSPIPQKEVEETQITPVQENFSPETAENLQKTTEKPPEPTELDQKQLKKDAASAVVRRMVYNPDDETLKVIFNNNAAYNYYDVPEDSWKKLSEGQASAKTNGQNEFGVWWAGKNPSTGAALNEYIKKPEYIYEKLDDEMATQDDLDNVIQEIKSKVQEYKAAPKDGKKTLFDEINRLRQVEANLRKAIKKKPSQ